MTSKMENITESLNESLVLKALSPENMTPINFPIVGIGASAGGLEALKQFFENMPGDCGMAFVVIQHLDPNYIGVLPELLQRYTTMKVLQATDKLKIKPNHIYVIPPNKDISILKGELYLFAPTEARGLRLPIDTFFRSLAAEKCEKSIGIVLSGMGSDGSLGVKSIKERNGIVLVQDPVTAKFNAMPTHAREAVSVDIIALASELPAKLITFLDSNHLKNYKAEPDSKIIRYLNKILILIREQSGHDFSMYKKNTLILQIDKRKGIHQIEKIGNYVRYLQENPNEVEILYKEMLIGVSSFFRDSALWEMLREKTIPDLIENSAGGTILRAWVTACSTGEEAYSLAIIFKEVMEQKKMVNISLQIFATDIDSDAIDYARKGIFSKKISSEISPERMSKFFISEANGFRINSAIREMVIFATQNVIKDPPFTKIDILTCRNLLIYMEPELQNKMMSLFHYSLNLSGIMILGSAENPRGLSTGFAEINSKLKIYKRSLDTSTTALIDFPSSFHHKKEVASGNKIPPKKIDNIQIITDQFLLQHFTPPSVLVNASGDILNITGRTGKYLEPASGKANWNIFAMARKGIIEELPGALRKVQLSFDPIIIPNLKVGTNGGTQYLNMTVQRLEISNSTEDLILIVFIDVPSPIEKLTEIPKNGKQRSISHQIELENQLKQRNELIQSIREEMQIVQEELQSTNEEYQSANEELQSTNVELITSQEELQSLNEELQTVIIELQCKVSDFLQTYNDLENLLNSTEIATLFLDTNLNIRRFTGSVLQVFKLRDSDIGRPFTDLVTHLNYPEIEKHAKMVLNNLSTIETTTSTNDNRWFTVRIMPYRTHNNIIEGLVITFLNISLAENLKFLLKEKNDAIALSEVRYRSLFESAKDGIMIVNADTGIINDVNPYLLELLGYSLEEMKEKYIWEIGFLKDLVANKERFSELQKKKIIRYGELPLETADGKKIKAEFLSNVYQVNNQVFIQCNIRTNI